MNPFYRILKITRVHQYLHNLFFGILPLLLYVTSIFDISKTLLVLFLEVAFGFMVNDYFDVDVDSLDKTGKKSSIISRSISKKGLKYLIIIFLTLSLTLTYIFFGAIAFLVITFICLGSYSYSAEPIRLKKNSWLEFPIVVIAFGPGLMFFTYVANKLVLDMSFVYLSIICFLYISITQLLNCIRDFDFDKRVGLKNLVQQIGLKNSLFLAKLGVVFLFALELIFFTMFNEQIAAISLVLLTLFFVIYCRKIGFYNMFLRRGYYIFFFTLLLFTFL